MPVLTNRGQFLESYWSRKTLITVHPSSVLRAMAVESGWEEYNKFVEDLKKITAGKPLGSGGKSLANRTGHVS